MKVSVCTLTYGRNQLLNEAVESFLRQDFLDSEMVVFNTLESQQLVSNNPRVRVVNYKPRPVTLGITRNLAIQHCRGQFILNLDDDDIIRPHYIGWLVSHIGDSDCVKQMGRFNLTKGRVDGVNGQATNSFMFSKMAWALSGGYPDNMDSGEDRLFVKALKEKVRFSQVECPKSEYGFLYGWGQGCYHVSALGENQTGRPSALSRSRQFVQRTNPPKGRVAIRPAWNRDYEKLVQEWLKKNP